MNKDYHYHWAIQRCLRLGRPEHMDIIEWNRYKMWAKEKLRELEDKAK